jgi:hypothetical protein
VGVASKPLQVEIDQVPISISAVSASASTYVLRTSAGGGSATHDKFFCLWSSDFALINGFLFNCWLPKPNFLKSPVGTVSHTFLSLRKEIKRLAGATTIAPRRSERQKDQA